MITVQAGRLITVQAERLITVHGGGLMTVNASTRAVNHHTIKNINESYIDVADHEGEKSTPKHVPEGQHNKASTQKEENRPPLS